MATETERVDHFGAGPGALPLPVLEQAQQELLNYRHTGMSVLELSHRSHAYEQIQASAEQRLRALLAIPDDYAVLFLQGGASMQFAMVALNFLSAGLTAGYILTGSWSEKAFKEAQHVGRAVVCASTKSQGYTRIPRSDELALDGVNAYVHLTSNNTIYGTQWHAFPDTGTIPRVADMSSDLLSRPVDVERFGLIYAGAQKNLGPAGVTIAIVRKSWLEAAINTSPVILRYETHEQHRSLYNTPPTFAVYILNLVLAWAEEQGGVTALAEQNSRKASLLYDVMDEYPDFYDGHAEKDSRSMMNVTFRLPTEQYTTQFFQEAKDAGFVGLAGHRSVGGCRASLYNAVTLAACERLAQFMEDFRRRRV